MTDGRLAESVKRWIIGRFETVASVHQDIDAGEVAAATEKGIDQRRPGLDLGFRRSGITVAGHVHHVEALATGKEDELLRAARRA